jgi:hypothetical protein
VSTDPEDLPQVLMIPHELITVAEGRPVTTRTADDVEVLVRIPTTSELLAAVEAAGRRLEAKGLPKGPGMTAEQADRFTTPLDFTEIAAYLARLRNGGRQQPVDLADRVDPAVAVDRALPAEDRVRFMARLTGPWHGAQPADYLDDAINNDAHTGAVEDWFAGVNQGSEKYLPAQIAVAYGIPEPLAARLLHTAVVACIVTDQIDRAGGAQAPIDLAGRAALYTRGIADTLGIEATS